MLMAPSNSSTNVRDVHSPPFVPDNNSNSQQKKQMKGELFCVIVYQLLLVWSSWLILQLFIWDQVGTYVRLWIEVGVVHQSIDRRRCMCGGDDGRQSESIDPTHVQGGRHERMRASYIASQPASSPIWLAPSPCNDATQRPKRPSPSCRSLAHTCTTAASWLFQSTTIYLGQSVHPSTGNLSKQEMFILWVCRLCDIRTCERGGICTVRERDLAWGWWWKGGFELCKGAKFFSPLYVLCNYYHIFLNLRPLVLAVHRGEIDAEMMLASYSSYSTASATTSVAWNFIIRMYKLFTDSFHADWDVFVRPWLNWEFAATGARTYFTYSRTCLSVLYYY